LKFANDRFFADPEKAARRLMEHARAFEPIQDGRIYIEKINGPFLFGRQGHTGRVFGGPRAGYRAQLACDARESGTIVKFGQARADLCA
jgi:hypothetical protein